jgi:nitrogenase molybdenum-iron protein alpha/beta subunit
MHHDRQELLTAGDWDVYDDFLRCGQASLQLVTSPKMLSVAEMIQKRQGIPYLYAPLSYRLSEIENAYVKLDNLMGWSIDRSALYAAARKHMEQAAQRLGGRPLAVHLGAAERPGDLARALLEYGFQIHSITLKEAGFDQDGDILWLA